jgi:hypothetical protein
MRQLSAEIVMLVRTNFTGASQSVNLVSEAEEK